MNINYILSDTTKNASSRAIAEIVKKSEENPLDNILVIVPETKSIIIENELLSQSKNGSFLNVYVYSFVRLISRLGCINPSKIVSKQTCVLILRKIASKLKDELGCYGRSAKTIGFAEKMYETIQQLKSSGITPEDLKKALDTDSESLKLKMQDILLIYEEYDRILSGKLFDDCDKLNLLKEFASQSEIISSSEIYIVGFDNITYEMESVLREFAVHAKSITFSSVYFNENREDKYIQNNELYKKFRRIADDLKYPYVPKKYSSVLKGDFYRIANNLLSNKKYNYKSDGSVTVFKAQDKKQEIEFVASEILRQVKRGKRYKDIGVFLCDLEGDYELIKNAFESFGIPYFINKSYSLGGHFLARFVRSAFDVFSSHFENKSVLEFLSNPLVELKSFGEFQNFVRELGINYNAFLNFDLEKNEELAAKYENLTENLMRLRGFISDFKDRFRSARTVCDFVNVIISLFEYFNVAEKLESISKFEEKSGLKIESEISLQILSKVERFNENLLNFLGDEEVSSNEFLEIYFTGFDMIKINLAPLSIDCVVVQDSTDGFFDISTMFVVGAIEGNFPRKLHDTGIILDSELEITKKLVNFSVEPSIKDINARENFRVYESLLEPKEKLFVTYSLKSENGGLNRRANIVDRLISLFGEEIIAHDFSATDFVNYKTQEKRFAKHVEAFLKGKYNLTDLNYEYNQISDNFSERYKNFLDNLSFSRPEFVLNDASGLYFKDKKTSVSQLETYFSCPYKYFARYGLKLKENTDAKLSSMDIGNIMHKLAEIFMNKLGEFNEISESQFDEKVKQILTQSLKENNVNPEINVSVIKLLFGEAKRLCRHLLTEQENSGFKNKKELNEFEFKGKNGIKLLLSNGDEILVEGKIDRIDKFGNYIRIIDYKTGAVDCNLSSVYYGKKIQLVSYLSAAESALSKGNEKMKVAGLFYFPIHSEYADDEKKSKNMYKMNGFLLDDIDVVKNMDYNLSFENNESHFVPIKIKKSKDVINKNLFLFSNKSKTTLSAEELETIKNYIEKLCSIAVSEILEGYIEPSPLIIGSEVKKMPCGHCEFAGFCGLDKARFANGRKCDGTVNIERFEQED